MEFSWNEHRVSRVRTFSRLTAIIIHHFPSSNQCFMSQATPWLWTIPLKKCCVMSRFYNFGIVPWKVYSPLHHGVMQPFFFIEYAVVDFKQKSKHFLVFQLGRLFVKIKTKLSCWLIFEIEGPCTQPQIKLALLYWNR